MADQTFSKETKVPKPDGRTRRSLAAESAPHRPAHPLLGVLPVARVIPMDVHSVMDYVSSAAAMSALLLADSPAAKITGAVVGSTAAAVSLFTDYRLSAVKLIPIEVHEVIDYVYGLSLAVAPFVLRYLRSDPLVAGLHIGVGLSVIIASLLTDYRAEIGIGARMGALLEGG